MPVRVPCSLGFRPGCFHCVNIRHCRRFAELDAELVDGYEAVPVRKKHQFSDLAASSLDCCCLLQSSGVPQPEGTVESGGGNTAAIRGEAEALEAHQSAAQYCQLLFPLPIPFPQSSIEAGREHRAVLACERNVAYLIPVASESRKALLLGKAPDFGSVIAKSYAE